MMTRSLSADLRGRVIAAIEDGVATREAARRFRIGISTAGSWYRRCRGEMEARKPGQPSRSKLDAHEAFILGLIELAEIGERLAAERGVWAAPSTVWLFLDRRGIMFKTYGPPARGLFLMAAGLHQRIRRIADCSRPRWRSARSGLLKSHGVKAPSFEPGFQNVGSTVRPSFKVLPQKSSVGRRPFVPLTSPL
ncbi:hypothetical protein NKH53_30965 [Mesorhizobium australicum]|uniref:hypothetical protein n=1 Tax=Mesorhizobium australicum TaxID=536018 RepID=UPI0033397596